jgi:hypothetical protein
MGMTAEEYEVDGVRVRKEYRGRLLDWLALLVLLVSAAIANIATVRQIMALEARVDRLEMKVLPFEQMMVKP